MSCTGWDFVLGWTEHRVVKTVQSLSLKAILKQRALMFLKHSEGRASSFLRKQKQHCFCCSGPISPFCLPTRTASTGLQAHLPRAPRLSRAPSMSSWSTISLHVHISEHFQSTSAVRSVFSSCAALRNANTAPWVPKYETHSYPRSVAECHLTFYSSSLGLVTGSQANLSLKVSSPNM